MTTATATLLTIGTDAAGQQVLYRLSQMTGSTT